MIPAAALFKPTVLWFAATGDNCTLANHSFFFLPPWWEFLQPKINDLGQCAVTLDVNGKFSLSSIWGIGLAILDMLLRIGGFVAVISIIIAGIQYITATGEPEKGANARRRLTNSLIGLAIIIIAAGAVAFIGNSVG